MREWTTQQQKIFSSFDSRQHIMIKAVAGSGKTSTVIEGANRSKSRALFLAFNKSIAQELGDKLPKSCSAKTTHSFGRSLLGNTIARNGLKVNKIDIIMKDILSEKEYKMFGAYVRRMVSLAKGDGYVPANNRDFDTLPGSRSLDEISNHYGVVIDDAEEQSQYDFANTLVDKVLNASIMDANLGTNKGIIDFDDMIYMAAIKHGGRTLRYYDTVIVDEAQDLNNAQINMLNDMANSKFKPKIIAVGDPAQAIYGFRGAMHDSMDKIQAMMENTSRGFMPLDLSVTFRCAKSIVEKAKGYVAEISAAPFAEEGVIDSTTFNDDVFDQMNGDTLVVCRKNAPLLSLAYKFIANKKAVRIMGRDIGNNLAMHLKKVLGSRRNKMSISEMEMKVQEYTDKKIQTLLAMNKNSMADVVSDKGNALAVVLSNSEADSFDGVVNEIKSIFSDEKMSNAPTLSSIHKAKGLEADAVFWLEPDGTTFAKKTWEFIQEDNMKYVAITRAKTKLTYLEFEES